jgi:hypothetical protein
MKILNVLVIICGITAFTNCAHYNKKDNSENENASIWRDHNVKDSASFYASKEACNKIIGTLKITSRLHKNLLEKDVFGGGMSSRWLEIRKDSIFYYTPTGEIADQGKCSCKNGILKVDWKKRYKDQMKYNIYFNSSDFVELRYYDYPYSFDTFEYDTSKEPTNPTKIIGTLIK